MGFDDPVARTQVGLQVELDLALLARAVDELALIAVHEPVEPAQAALGLAGVLAGHVAPDELLLLGDQGLLSFILELVAGVAVGALHQIGRVVAAKLGQAAKGQLPDSADHLVEKIAVVRDDEHRAVPSVEPAFQPLHGVDVEVVGGLVEDEQIGAFKQQPAQQRAGLLPARKLGHRPVILVRLEIEAGEHLLDAGFILIAPIQLELMLERAIALEGALEMGRVGHGRLEAGQLGLARAQIIKGAQHLFPQGALGVDGRLLRQEAQPQALRALHQAGRRLFQARQQA